MKFCFPLILEFDGFKLTVFHVLKILLTVTVRLLVRFIIVLCGTDWWAVICVGTNTYVIYT
jgi:hypothetical protein